MNPPLPASSSVPAPAPAGPRRRRGRYWAVAALVALLALGVCEWAQWPFLRGPLQQAAQRALHRPVMLGADFGIRLLGSVRVNTDALRVDGDPPPRSQAQATGEATLLQADGVQLEVPYASLLRVARGQGLGALHLKTLIVRRLDLLLQRRADGVLNWQLGSAPPNAAPGRSEAAALPEVDRLIVEQGRVRFDDAVMQLSVVVDLATREGAGPAARTTAADAAASAPSAAQTPQRGLQASATGTYRRTPVRAALHAAGLLPLATSGSDAPAVPFDLDVEAGRTRLQLHGSARDLRHLHDLNGQFKLEGPSLAAVGDVAGLTLPTTAAFAMHGDIRKQGQRWSADVGELAVGESRLRGHFQYDVGAPIGHLQGTLAGAKLNLPDLAPAFGGGRNATSAGAAPPPQSDGRVLPQREFDLPSLGAMQADLRIELDTVDLGSSQLAPFTPLHATLSLHDKVLVLSDVLARSSGGEVRGEVSLDARADPPLWKGDVRWSAVQLERFIKARNRVAAAGKPGAATTPASPAAASAFVSGRLNGQAHLQGRGHSTARMLASLDGWTRMWVQQGEISHLLIEVMGLDVAESLGWLVRGDKPLPLSCALAQVTAKDGRVHVDLGVLDTTDTTVFVNGDLSLVQEQLALQLRAQPKDFSPLALRAPVRVEGSFAQPKVGLDVPRMGARLAAAAGLAAAAPVAALLALFDLGEPERAVCQRAWEQVKHEPPRKTTARRASTPPSP